MIYANKPAVRIAKTNRTFAAMGLDDTNAVEIFEVADALQGWQPELGGLNPIDRITEGLGYYIVLKQDKDLDLDFGPPFPPSGGSLDWQLKTW